MKALRDKHNYLKHMAYNIVRDDGEDQYEWILYEDDHEIRARVQDDDYVLVEFDDAALPQDYFEDKYWFIDGEFVVDPQWGTPAPPFKDQIEVIKRELRQTNSELSDAVSSISRISANVSSIDSKYDDVTVSAEEALCDLDEAISARLDDIEEALIELSEMIN